MLDSPQPSIACLQFCFCCLSVAICFAWREMKGRGCGRHRLWFVVTHITEQQSLALRQKLPTDSTGNFSLNLCVVGAVSDPRPWLESFTPVPNLGLPLLNVSDLLLEKLAINNDDKETCGNAVALMDFPLSQVPKSVFLWRPITN